MIKSCNTEEQLFNIKIWLEKILEKQSLGNLNLTMVDCAFIFGLISGKIAGLRK